MTQMDYIMLGIVKIVFQTTHSEQKNEQGPYWHLTSAIIDRFSIAYVGKFLREINRISSQRYAIVTTYFFHFKWQTFLNLRISFQIARGYHPRITFLKFKQYFQLQ